MPRRPNPFQRIIQWVRRRTSSSEEDEHRLSEQRLLEQPDLEQRIREQYPQRRAGRRERRQRFRVLYTNQWTESQQDLAELVSEGRQETHRPGEAIIYRVHFLEIPEALENIRQGLFMSIEENGMIFKFELLQMHDGEVTWVMQISPQE